jgi:hypothetical protein
VLAVNAVDSVVEQVEEIGKGVDAGSVGEGGLDEDDDEEEADESEDEEEEDEDDGNVCF